MLTSGCILQEPEKEVGQRLNGATVVHSVSENRELCPRSLGLPAFELVDTTNNDSRV